MIQQPKHTDNNTNKCLPMLPMHFPLGSLVCFLVLIAVFDTKFS